MDLQVLFTNGESILTEIYRKFDLATMEEQLENKGLKILKNWTDEKGWFGLILCQVE